MFKYQMATAYTDDYALSSSGPIPMASAPNNLSFMVSSMDT